MTATSTTAGVYSVGSTLEGVLVTGSPQTIAFAAGAPSAATSTITASPAQITADGATTSTITVTLFDGTGNPVTSGSAVVAVATNLGTVSATTANGDGTYTATLRSTSTGTATVSFTLDGVAGTATTTVKVVSAVAPPKPIVNPTNGDTVTGTAQPGTTVQVTDPAGTVLCSTTADSTGAFSCVPAPTPADGDVLSVTATDPTGATSAPTTVIVDRTPPPSPVVDPTDGGTVNGIAEPGGLVEVKDTGGNTLCSTTAGADGSFTCVLTPPAAPGEDLTVTVTDPAGNVSPGTTVPALTVNRVAGGDRYGTSVEVSQKEFPGTAPVVFIASGANFPDALSAGPAAAKAGGPVLLSTPGYLPTLVAAEILRLHPSRIVIAGGPNAISDTVLNQLRGLIPGTPVAREYGGDRYGTSQAIIAAEFTTAPRVYVATGTNFPDALVAGGAAGTQLVPVLLVPGGASGIDQATRSTISRLGATAITITGGTNAVSAGMANSLGSLGTVTRLAGADRYGTAVAINQNLYSTAGTVMIATGFNFPDALTAAPWAAQLKAPMYLAPGTCVPRQVLAGIRTLGATTVTLIGGTAVLTESVAQLKPCGF